MQVYLVKVVYDDHPDNIYNNDSVVAHHQAVIEILPERELRLHRLPSELGLNAADFSEQTRQLFCERRATLKRALEHRAWQIVPGLDVRSVANIATCQCWHMMPFRTCTCHARGVHQCCAT